MFQRPRESIDMLGSGEGDDGDLTPGGLNLLGVSTELGQVILAEEAAEVAEKDQDCWISEQLPGRKTVTGNVAQFEIELDSRHRDLG
jgi:hypothetical protein